MRTPDRSVRCVSCSTGAPTPTSYLTSRTRRLSRSTLTTFRTRLYNQQREARLVCASSGPEIDFDLDIPDIGGDIRFLQEELGGIFDENGVVVSFGNSVEVDQALENGFVVFDQSNWGRFKVGGEGSLDFLHGQSTNDFKGLKQGQGCDTVFVTATARTIDLATCYVQKQGVLVITSPNTSSPLLQRLDKYVFPGDNVQLMDLSDKCTILSIVGPQVNKVVEELKVEGLGGGARYGDHVLLNLNGSPVLVAKGSALTPSGYTFVVDEAVVGELWDALVQKGGTPLGGDDYERLRVLVGRPLPGKELTEDYNPLEAGLYHAISLDKGCYIGQETLAKVYNKNAVKQQLWGIRLSGKVDVGDDVVYEGKRVGRITSVTETLGGQNFGLGYVRCKKKGEQVELEGRIVEVGDKQGVIADVEFLNRDFVDGVGAPVPSESKVGEGEDDKASTKEAEDLAKQERLKAMQGQLAAYMAQQKKQQ